MLAIYKANTEKIYIIKSQKKVKLTDLPEL